MAQNSAPQNYLNAGHFYSNIAKPVEIDLTFKVDSSNANGLGVSSVKSNGYVKNVYMHTSQTPATGNPNPLAGFCWIQLAGNFNHYINDPIMIQSPNTGSIKIDNGATLTLGQAYVITTLGNATASQWTTVGVPAGVTPAVGVSFIAIATGAGSGNTSTSRVSTPSTSGVTKAEIVGTPDTSIANSNVPANGGAWLLLQFLAPTSSSVTTATPTAPTDGSIVSMSIKFDASSVSVDGL